ncbi:E3 ubiquitin-protein ligase TRIM39-like isoform X2 [Ambystoma mexicanum]|uniref:E3 ubiquitin-protein ligase TRIM39-like isoform X2 n=1 Tax=Ambystoma mexicanum TaxID=8296 RepID=UPI0037E6FCE4
MDASDEYLPLKTEATCLICLQFFTEPVITECGHNFCKPCITACWEVLTGEFPCPRCRTIFPEMHLLPNRQLGNVAELVKEMSLKRKRESTVNLCEKHNAELKLFCQDDMQSICKVCQLSDEHMSHTIISIRKAVRKYKTILERDTESIKKTLIDMAKINSANVKNASELEEQYESQRILNSFDEMRFIVKMCKMQLCLAMDEDQKHILNETEGVMEKLKQQQASFQTYISLLTKKLEQPDVELLRDMKSILRRCEQLLVRTESDAVSQCIQAFQNQQSLIYHNIQKTKETLYERLGDINLDEDTAHPLCALSDNRKSLKVGVTWQDLQNTAERFDKRLCVLGKERLSYGRHYWEVVVGNAKNWDIGVCDKFANRKGVFQPTTENRYWALGLEDGKNYKVFTSPSITPIISSKPLTVIGVYLDCEAGNVTFYNVEEASKLFTLHPRPLPSIFLSYFCTGDKNNTLQLCPVLEK